VNAVVFPIEVSEVVGQEAGSSREIESLVVFGDVEIAGVVELDKFESVSQPSGGNPQVDALLLDQCFVLTVKVEERSVTYLILNQGYILA